VSERHPHGNPGSSLWPLAATVGATTVAAVVGLVAVRALVDPSTLEASNDVVGNYLQTAGTIYAVLLAFVVFVVWTQYNDARSYFEREANEVVDIFRTAQGLPSPFRQQIGVALLDYTDAIVAKEWRKMADDACHPFCDGGTILDQLWIILRTMEVSDEKTAIYYGEVLARLNDLSDVRARRITASITRIPLALLLLLYIGGTSTVASMYLFAVADPLIHALITGAMAGAIAHILYVIRDLDDCFDGNWRISHDPFVEARAYMRAAQPSPA
jgi:hypothetical protein